MTRSYSEPQKQKFAESSTKAPPTANRTHFSDRDSLHDERPSRVGHRFGRLAVTPASAELLHVYAGSRAARSNECGNRRSSVYQSKNPSSIVQRKVFKSAREANGGAREYAADELIEIFSRRIDGDFTLVPGLIDRAVAADEDFTLEELEQHILKVLGLFRPRAIDIHARSSDQGYMYGNVRLRLQLQAGC